nr:MAG TPA: hypothetical protein [Caudoviricetes sp.]
MLPHFIFKKVTDKTQSYQWFSLFFYLKVTVTITFSLYIYFIYLFFIISIE